MARRNVFQSSNPVFNRAEGFKPGSGSAQGGDAGYGSPSSWSTGAGTATQAPYSGSDYGIPSTHGADQGRMTLDSVVQKTGLTLLLVVAAAALTWFLTPALDLQGRAATSLYAITIVSAIVGFGLAMVTSFKKTISPALVLAYALVEGVFIGALSKTYNAAFGQGIVTGAVIGTVCALAGTLAAYKFLGIKVGDRFRKGMVAAGFGLVGLIVLDFVLGMFNSAIGFNGMGALGLLMSVAILVFGIFSLIMDFDFVERGIDAQLPERESWRAAFGLTVSLVMIYVNLLRLLAILRGD
ncbi:membrane protein [Marmoricola endophyticus]|uniref:Membrane protein n=1 Tax=Marmoricola endophyticus TaxID=2040280 RepID=A0A917F172_9ACTN|nr:Bax inhibitor-1/YccA family protein [Marmoricola endophyticus]GGF42129.1 membrane protein [Marmoricola endophyticus]